MPIADAPALDADWEQYFAFELDEASGAFTVTLNEDGTRLLRAFRDEPDRRRPVPRREDITTTELRIPPGDTDLSDAPGLPRANTCTIHP